MRVVITGGPCSGKTTLVQELAARGLATVPEAALQVIEELNDSLGVEEQKHWRHSNLQEFQKRILRRQLALEAEALEAWPSSRDLVFFDRGCLDGLTYCRYFGTPPLRELLDVAAAKRYDAVFVLATLTDFVSRGKEGRTSDQQTSIALGAALESTYREYGYAPVAVAVAPVAQRADFVLGTVERAFGRARALDTSAGGHGG